MRQVGIDLVGLDQAAERDHVGDARHAAQVAFDHPILERAQLARRVAVALHAIAKNLSDGGRERCKLRLDARRQIRRGQALERLLARLK